ncbi:hypothetical protein L1987_60912 [Smallanthus sonchifolius]|uniref:Uncharacterized protein n=1 Tax=Smallanthus sonchifolius TaxID=185202 RepID=A0ACB9D9L4_9ASTR|nr:hypothetical protein L1987_60912 [Smallanthus sonchifolius]
MPQREDASSLAVVGVTGVIGSLSQDVKQSGLSLDSLMLSFNARIAELQYLIDYVFLNLSNCIQIPSSIKIQDLPVLVIVSMLVYFCFLEQLLVDKMGSGAIAISLPLSCILGLLASMSEETVCVDICIGSVRFSGLFRTYFYSKLNVARVLSVLATFARFDGTISQTNLVGPWKWNHLKSPRNLLMHH